MIKGFNEKYRFLSNFWPVPVYVNVESGIHIFASVENAYQALKCPQSTWDVFKACSPTKAKVLGKAGEAASEHDRLEIMTLLNRRKYANTHLAEKLLETGDLHIEETNHWGDKFWGVCKGVGHNHMGKILMKVRDELKSGVKYEPAIFTIADNW